MRKEVIEELEENDLVIVSKKPLVIESKDEKEGSEYFERYTGILVDLLLEEFEFGMEMEGIDFNGVKKLDDSQMLLLTAEMNYADEFDMSEFMVIEAGEFKKIIEAAEDYDDEIEWYFGTNEELCYDSGSDMLDEISVKKITEAEAEMINKIFDGGFGNAGFFDHLFEVLEDEDETDDDEFVDGILTNKDLKQIEFLKGKGWDIKQSENNEYSLVVSHKDEGESIINFGYLEELYKKIKREN